MRTNFGLDGLCGHREDCGAIYAVAAVRGSYFHRDCGGKRG